MPASKVADLLRQLQKTHHLSLEEYELILSNRTKEDEELAKNLAKDCTEEYYGNGVYTRGLIEFTNYCKNGCHYCGIHIQIYKKSILYQGFVSVVHAYPCCDIVVPSGLSARYV